MKSDSLIRSNPMLSQTPMQSFRGCFAISKTLSIVDHLSFCLLMMFKYFCLFGTFICRIYIHYSRISKTITLFKRCAPCLFFRGSAVVDQGRFGTMTKGQTPFLFQFGDGTSFGSISMTGFTTRNLFRPCFTDVHHW